MTSDDILFFWNLRFLAGIWCTVTLYCQDYWAKLICLGWKCRCKMKAWLVVLVIWIHIDYLCKCNIQMQFLLWSRLFTSFIQHFILMLWYLKMSSLNAIMSTYQMKVIMNCMRGESCRVWVVVEAHLTLLLCMECETGWGVGVSGGGHTYNR